MTDSGDEAHWWEDRLFRSVTLYPWATMDAEAELKYLAERDVNTVFVVTKESDGRVFYDSSVAPNQVPNRDLLSDLVDAARVHDVALVPSVFTLCDEHLVEQYPEAVQVAQEGTEIRYPNVSMEWMHWVCPNHDVVRDHLRSIIDELAEYDVDGIQFTHFEYQPIMNGESSYRSCFCEECVRRYEEEGVTTESSGGVALRCETITSMLDDLTASLRRRDDLMVNVELEAFADLDAAVADSREMLGVDPATLARFADVLTPRTAHVDLGLHPLWIRDVVRSLHEVTATPIVPSIRTSTGERPTEHVPADELMTAMQMALNGGARGVSLFSAGANVGRLTDAQWETAAATFEEFTYFEREYGVPGDESGSAVF
ncbi:family 10 glycosylhydrolase [Halegenticoccus tardaugens]|uniref:family 10 glycosylhydrolase n=1 Tax=Halegenticoccus tardaugens TaxID=2071624 RepID=UPI00100B8753|nr:family 10 glycosylhydrolase [Halegenticoccus tardaugens]